MKREKALSVPRKKKIPPQTKPQELLSNWQGPEQRRAHASLWKGRPVERKKCFSVKTFTANAVSGSRLWHRQENQMRTRVAWSRWSVSDFLARPLQTNNQEGPLWSPKEPVWRQCLLECLRLASNGESLFITIAASFKRKFRIGGKGRGTLWAADHLKRGKS